MARGPRSAGVHPETRGVAHRTDRCEPPLDLAAATDQELVTLARQGRQDAYA